MLSNYELFNKFEKFLYHPRLFMKELVKMNVDNFHFTCYDISEVLLINIHELLSTIKPGIYNNSWIIEYFIMRHVILPYDKCNTYKIHY